MASIVDKIKEFGKNVGEKTTDVIEMNKLNLKVSSKKSEFNKLKEKLGETVLEKFKNGTTFDESITEIINEITGVEGEIAELQEKVSTIKSNLKTSSTLKCPNCGEENSSDAKFCKSCGTKLEIAQEKEEPKDEGITCPKCGMKNEKGAKFCEGCGEPLNDKD